MGLMTKIRESRQRRVEKQLLEIERLKQLQEDNKEDYLRLKNLKEEREKLDHQRRQIKKLKLERFTRWFK